MAETDGVPSFPHERLDVYQAARVWVCEAHALAVALPRGQAHFADQLRRALLSVLLNLGEGLARDGQDVARFAGCADRACRWQALPPGASGAGRRRSLARGSAIECAVALDAMLDVGLVDEPAHAAARGRLLRIAAMLGGLRRSARGRGA